MEKVFLSLVGGLMVGAAAAGFGVYMTLGSSSDASMSKTRSAKAESRKEKSEPPTTDVEDNKELLDLKREVRELRQRLREKNSLIAKQANGKSLSSGGDVKPTSESIAKKESAAEIAKKVKRSEVLLGEAMLAIEAKNGEDITKLLLDLKNLGPAAYPALYKAYAAYDALLVDDEGNPLQWRARERKQRELGVDLRDLINGDLYKAIVSDTSGKVPTSMVTATMWRVQSDPYMDSAARGEAIRAMTTAYGENESVIQTALWSLGRAAPEERTNLALSLLATPNASTKIQESAINALPRNLDDKMVAQLENLRNSPDQNLQDSARYKLQQHSPSDTGYLVESVGGTSAAAAAGLRKGDIIVSINGKPMNQRNSIQSVKGDIKNGIKVPMVIIRDGVRVYQDIGVDERNRFGIDGGTVYKEGEEPQRADNNNRRRR